MTNDYENQFTILLEKNQHKILGRVERDTATLRLSALVAVQIADGRISEEVTIQRSRLLERGEKELLWIIDSSEYFEPDDLKKVKGKLMELLQKPPGKIVETAGKATKEEIYEELLTYIKKKGNELVSPDGVMIIIPAAFLKEKAGYIRTNEFESFVRESKKLGWSRQDILKMLKRNNLLETGKGRTYDKKVKVNGISNNYYIVKILQDENGNLITNDEAEESIDIKLAGGKDAD